MMHSNAGKTTPPLISQKPKRPITETLVKKRLSPIKEADEKDCDDDNVPSPSPPTPILTPPPAIKRIIQPTPNKTMTSLSASLSPVNSPDREPLSLSLSPENRSAFRKVTPNSTPQLTGMPDLMLPPPAKENNIPPPSIRNHRSSLPISPRQESLTKTIGRLKKIIKTRSKNLQNEVHRFIIAIEKEALIHDHNDLQRLAAHTEKLLSQKMRIEDYCRKAKQWGNQHPSRSAERIARVMLAIAAVLIVAGALVVPLFPIAIAATVTSISISASLGISGFFGLRHPPLTNRMLALEKALKNESDPPLALPHKRNV